MAYDVTEERLKVRGSEQITRDLKVNRDAFINGKAETGSIDDKGDLKVAGEILAGDDVTISGDLYVNGTEYINDSETAQTTDNYLVLRHNQTTLLGTNEYSGVAVHNYASGKTTTITTDKDGTWRVADNTETDTNYTNISYYNGTFYTGLTRTAATVISGMKTAFDEDELDESVYYNTSYYHFDGNNWFPVSLTDNKLTLGSAVTDSATITALNALTKEDLVYFRTLTITVINPVENQPLLTRAEASDLTGGQALTWDATNRKAVGKTIDTTVTANSSNLITSGGVYSGLAGKVDKETGKGLSTNDFTTALKDKLDGIEAGAEVNVQADWNQTDSTADDYIRNKPVIPPGVVVDTAMSDSSANAVENRVIKAYVDTAETNAKNLANATGTLAIAHGGTGATTGGGACTNLIGALTVATGDVTDNTDVITSNADGYAEQSDKQFYKRKGIKFWNYIKDKISSALGLSTTGLSTGTVTTTGDIHVGPGKSIVADGTKANYPAIKFKDAGTDPNGNGIVIGAGGATVIGGGESADTYYAGAGLAAGNEIMAITNDAAITFVSNLQSSYASGRAMTMGTDGKLTNTYGFVGPLTGNVTGNCSGSMDKTNPTGTGSFSLNRMAGTTVGTNSFAEGYNTTASGDSSHAEGYSTKASGYYSHAEGHSTKANGNYSHAEGYNTEASGAYSHAEGNTTESSGYYSHAEGYNTEASGNYQHVQGKYNVESTTWAFVIGGGTSTSARKNILAFDWDGNLHIFGDIYVHCNTDGTGGTKK